jgi:hypothetical protein
MKRLLVVSLALSVGIMAGGPALTAVPKDAPLQGLSASKHSPVQAGRSFSSCYADQFRRMWDGTPLWAQVGSAGLMGVLLAPAVAGYCSV